MVKWLTAWQWHHIENINYQGWFYVAKLKPWIKTYRHIFFFSLSLHYIHEIRRKNVGVIKSCNIHNIDKHKRKLKQYWREKKKNVHTSAVMSHRLQVLNIFTFLVVLYSVSFTNSHHSMFGSVSAHFTLFPSSFIFFFCIKSVICCVCLRCAFYCLTAWFMVWMIKRKSGQKRKQEDENIHHSWPSLAHVFTHNIVDMVRSSCLISSCLS